MQLYPQILPWHVWTVRNVNQQIPSIASMPMSFINSQISDKLWRACPLHTVNVLTLLIAKCLRKTAVFLLFSLLLNEKKRRRQGNWLSYTVSLCKPCNQGNHSATNMFLQCRHTYSGQLKGDQITNSTFWACCPELLTNDWLQWISFLTERFCIFVYLFICIVLCCDGEAAQCLTHCTWEATLVAQ